MHRTSFKLKLTLLLRTGLPKKEKALLSTSLSLFKNKSDKDMETTVVN